jgi:hypothetical protein
MPATINGTSGFGGNLTGNVTGNADTSTASTTATKLSTTAGDAPTYACRAWVNFDGTKDTTGANSTANTNRLIRAGGNVSSVLRTGAGQYTVTFAIAMPDANYAATADAPNSNGRFASITSTATGSCQVQTDFQVATAPKLDATLFSVAIFR